jgi:hypothetical protein
MGNGSMGRLRPRTSDRSQLPTAGRRTTDHGGLLWLPHPWDRVACPPGLRVGARGQLPTFNCLAAHRRRLHMIYLIGGAPRSGKTILSQQIAARLKIGCISTDILVDLLRFHGIRGPVEEWDASPEAIAAAAKWFYPTLERFVWGIRSMADSYVIDGVNFLPDHVMQLSQRYLGAVAVLGVIEDDAGGVRPLPRTIARLRRPPRGDAAAVRAGCSALERVYPCRSGTLWLPLY